MTPLGIGATVLVVAAIGAFAAALGGPFGVAVLGVGLLVLAALVILAIPYRAATAVGRPDPVRSALPTPPAATLGRDIAAVQMALRGPRWADTELRPTLQRIADALLQARTGRTVRGDPTAARAILGESLFWFVNPEREVRGHDDGGEPTMTDLDAMLTRLEDIS